MKKKENKTVQLRVCPADCGFWMEAILDDKMMKYLWRCVNKSKKVAISHKANLAGNISESYRMHDIDGKFVTDTLQPLVNEYIKINNNQHPHKITFSSVQSKAKLKLTVSDLWVNFQNKHEFNPPHSHDGMYSFVIWMKIPYNYEEERKLPFLDGVKEPDKKPGNFEFSYPGMLGEIRTTTYYLSPEMEGHMLVFPAGLTHQVYPFYTSDEQRVSISGNVWTVYE